MRNYDQIWRRLATVLFGTEMGGYTCDSRWLRDGLRNRTTVSRAPEIETKRQLFILNHVNNYSGTHILQNQKYHWDL